MNIHYILHDLYGYLGFLIQVPFHKIFHEPEDGCDVFGWNGVIICKCGYIYDRGYYQSNCRRCWDYENQLYQRRIK